MKSYLLRRSEIMDKIDQQKEQARDSAGRRWLKCEICGRVGESDEFIRYGGPNHVNLGVCFKCAHRDIDPFIESLACNGGDD